MNEHMRTLDMKNQLDHHTPRHRLSGMTLIELMIAIAILVVLMVMAIPSFQSLIASSRLRTASSDFSITLAQARSNAIRRGARVTVCKSSNGTQCATTGDWSQGWIMFEDDTHSGTNPNVDTVASVTETITRVAPATTSGIVIKSNNQDYVSFAADGQPKNMDGGGYYGTMRICSTSTALSNDARASNLVLSRTGRIVIEKQTGIAATCPAP